MAKAESLFKLRGTIGGLTFRQTESGTVAQSKPGPTREEVLNNKRFDVTRRNAGEFKLATQHGMLLRRALGSALNSVKRPSLNGHVIGLMHRVAMLDGQSEYGSRTAGAGDMSLLEGFEFGKQLWLNAVLPVKFEHGLNVKTGVFKLEMPSFIARRKKVLPAEATHFRIVSCGAVVDFDRNTYKNSIKRSELLPLSKKTCGNICLEHVLKAAAGEVMVHVMGIEYYKVENGEEVLLKDGAVRILEAVRSGFGVSDSGFSDSKELTKSNVPCLRESSGIACGKHLTAEEFGVLGSGFYGLSKLIKQEMPDLNEFNRAAISPYSVRIGP